MDLQDYTDAVRAGRVLALNGLLEEESINDFRKQINKVLDSKTEGELFVSLTTSGGDLDQSVVLYQDLVMLNSIRKVYIVCQAQVASAGLHVIVAVPREQRLAIPPTVFYVHGISMGVKFDTERAGLPQHKYQYREYEARLKRDDKLNKRLLRILSRKTTISYKIWKKYQRRPYCFFEKEALRHGLIGGILE